MQRGRRNGRKERNGNELPVRLETKYYEVRLERTNETCAIDAVARGTTRGVTMQRGRAFCGLHWRSLACVLTGYCALSFVSIKKAVARDSQDTLTLHTCDVDTHPRRARERHECVCLALALALTTALALDVALCLWQP